MAKSNVSKKILTSTSKIVTVADLLLNQEGHELKVGEIHLVPKNGPVENKIVCSYVLINGKWVLQCN